MGFQTNFVKGIRPRDNNITTINTTNTTATNKNKNNKYPGATSGMAHLTSDTSSLEL